MCMSDSDCLIKSYSQRNLVTVAIILMQREETLSFFYFAPKIKTTDLSSSDCTQHERGQLEIEPKSRIYNTADLSVSTHSQLRVCLLHKTGLVALDRVSCCLHSIFDHQAELTLRRSPRFHLLTP